MVFNSPVFLFLFLPATIAVYFIVPKKLRGIRNFILLAASLGFYFYGEPKAIFLLLVSVTGNYLFALAIGVFRAGDVVDAVPRKSGAGVRRLFLIIAVVFNLCILGYFKYAGFFVANINAVAGTAFNIPDIALPLGISFFTFQGLSYVFDVYKRKVAANKNFFAVALYMTMFPSLISGPIARFGDILPQIINRDESVDKASAGIRRFIFGMAKKVLVADVIGALTAELLSVSSLGTADAWLGAAAYTLQIFLDFSGYSDMAIGMAQIFGFKLPENFDYPYTARSVTEFWRRWHMSLSSWFRDYVYIPLGGNRRGLLRQLLNIAVVWALTGLWHGAAWNFVLWGLYFALLLALEKLFLGKLLEKLPRFVGHLWSLLAIVVGWVIFSAPSVAAAFSWLGAMFTPIIGASSGARALFLLGEYKLELIAGVIISLPFAKFIAGRWGSCPWYMLARDISVCVLFLLCIARVAASTFVPFMYFKF